LGNYGARGQRLIKVTAMQTGTVSIRPLHMCGEEGRGPVQRKLDMLRDKGWVKDLPIYCYLIEHPEGNFVVDSGDNARNSRKDYLPAWNPFFAKSVDVRVAPGEEVGDHLRALGINPVRDIKALILTHMHHDHAGGLDHFPHTPILVSRENFLFANSFKGRIFGCLPQHFPRWLDPELVDCRNEQFGPFPRSYPVTKDKSIVMVPAPGHMVGHMAVIVRTPDVTYCFSGDATYNQELMLAGKVSGVTDNLEWYKQTLQQIMALGRQEPTVLLPAHDIQSEARIKETICLPKF